MSSDLDALLISLYVLVDDPHTGPPSRRTVPPQDTSFPRCPVLRASLAQRPPTRGKDQRWAARPSLLLRRRTGCDASATASLDRGRRGEGRVEAVDPGDAAGWASTADPRLD